MLVEVLPGDGILLEQLFPAFERHFGQHRIGLGLFELRLALGELLVEFGRIEFGQQLSLDDPARRCRPRNCAHSR